MDLNKALKAFQNVMHNEANAHCALSLVTKQALQAAAVHLQMDQEGDDVLTEPLPEWAVGQSYGELKIGVQLCTKDGRQVGNAFVIDIWENDLMDQYIVITDSGNTMRLTHNEVGELFYVGKYICGVERILRDFDRTGEHRNALSSLPTLAQSTSATG